MNRSGAAVALVASLLIVAPAIAQDSDSSTRPPQNLKKVGDHWTPWDPPPPAPGAYIIVKDDTLWDLAERWLGDPYLWPQIWDENRYILDSHWIYPGDPLVIPGRPTVVPEGGPPTASEEPEPVEEPEAEGPGGAAVEPEPEPLEPEKLVPIAGPTDIYCSGYIDPDHQFSDLWIAGSEVPEIAHYATGDVLFLSQGRNQGIRPGDEFLVTRATRPVTQPDGEGVIGRFVRRLGKLRVMLVQDNTATAVVEMACEDLRDSDELVPWQEIPVPEVYSMPIFNRYDVTPSGGPTGRLVYLADDLTHVGEGHVVQVDLGLASGVQPGDVLTLYSERGELPRSNLGQGIVLTVEQLSSTVKVTDTVRELSVGDHAEIVR
jgi:hypothetical protein